MDKPITGNVDRWQRLEEIFAAAVELSGQEQAERVARECGEDEGLRQQVTELLRHSEGAPERIAATIEAAAQTISPSGDWKGRRFGPYRIEREVGRGGMGIVFEARRDDAEYEKRVALKVAWGLRDVRGMRERFRKERQILAELEHPLIGRFLDGGTEEGLPYLAMEFVEGRPVTEYCEERKLSLAGRITLFREICTAIDYAHGRLIVHRDLKPSNILVDNQGRPKVLDFGIAKLLGQDGPGRETTGIGMWTPDYASPEQVRGKTITTRRDVYALGLILFEMLTGKRAQVADTSSPLALDRSVCETEAQQASAVSDAARARQLEGDLDQIIAKALDKAPERRYASVSALSEDLGRHLAGEPVLARASTRLYRMSKFVRRHRIAVAVATVVVVSVLGGSAVAVVQARRAERRFQQVRQLANTFLFAFHDQLHGLEGATGARELVASTAMKYLDSLAAEAGNDAVLQMELATAYVRLGAVQGQMGGANLGQRKEALASYGKAIQLATEVLERDGGNVDALRLLAQSLGEKGEIETIALGDGKTGLVSLQRALQYSHRLVDGTPDSSDQHRHLTLLRRQADRKVGSSPKEAIPLYREAVERGTALLQSGASDTERVQVATSCARLSRALHNVGDPLGGLTALQRGVDLLEPVLSKDGPNAMLGPVLNALLIQMGALLGDAQSFSLNQPDKALATLERVRRLNAQAIAADEKNVHARENMALVLQRMAGVQLSVDGKAAIVSVREALKLAEGLQKKDGASPRLALIVSSLRKDLAWMYLEAGEPQRATAQQGTAPKTATEALAKDENDLGGLEVAMQQHWVMGRAYGETRQWALAAHHLEEARVMGEALTKRLPEDLFFLRDYAQVEEARGDLAAARGDTAEAGECWRRALGMWEKWSRVATAVSVFPELHKERLQKKLGRV